MMETLPYTKDKMQDTQQISKIFADEATHAISVLLPTRGRTDLLKSSLDSLLDRADDVSQIEILMGFDNDDTVSFEWCQEHVIPDLEERGVDAMIVQFNPMGYARLNEYLNSMAAISNGRWLFFWNDDARMETQSWDSRILEHDGEFVVQRVLTHNQHPYSIFPILPRDWYYLLGHLSEHQLNDASISQIAYMLDIMRTIEVEVTHDRADLTGNNHDETFKRRTIFEGNSQDPRDFNYHTYRNRRFNDANRLSWYLKKIGQPSTWFDEVIRGRRDPWTKMISEENDPNHQVRVYR